MPLTFQESDRLALIKLLRTSVAIIFIAFFLAIFNGLIADDYQFVRVFVLHADALTFTEQIKQAFAFSPSAQANQQAIEYGYGWLNWWSDTDSQHWFFRPVAALTHYLDFKFLGNQFTLMHLHSYVYFLLSGFLLMHLLGRMGLSKLQQWLVFALFFVDSVSLWAGWLAQRNAYITLCFMLVSMIFYCRYLTESHYRFLLVTFSCFVLAFLSSESGLATSIFLFFMPLVYRQKMFTVRHLAPMAVVAIIALMFLGFYMSSGYGAKNNPHYYHQILPALGSLVYKVPAAFSVAPLADLAFFIKTTFAPRYLFTVYAVINCGAVFGLFHAYKVIDVKSRPLFLYGIFCACGTLLPLAASLVVDRSVIYLKLAIAISLSTLIVYLFNSQQARVGTRKVINFIPKFFVAKAVALFAIAAVVAVSLQQTKPNFEPLAQLPDSAQHIMYLKNHDMAESAFLLEKAQYFYSKEVKTAQRLLSNHGSVVLTRLDDKTIILRTEQGALFKREDLIMKTMPFVEGQVFHVKTMDITIIEVNAGLPVAIQVRFNVNMNETVFLSYGENGHYDLLQLPEVQQSIKL